MKDNNFRIVYEKENLISSLVADCLTFGVIVASFWFNLEFIDGNNWLDALLFICFFFFALGKAGNVKRRVEMIKADQALFKADDE
ncbi:MAG: hypothetical protein ABIR46_03030 [Candidatus Saccharimonadales bacterium]